MNAERLHALLEKIEDEIDTTEVRSRLTELSGALQGVMAQPDSNRQTRSGSAVTSFRDSLASSTLIQWSPAWRELLEETGYAEFLGSKLVERIDQLLSQNEITPSIVKEDVDEVLQKLEALYKSIAATRDGFTLLNIGSDDLEPGKCEVGFLIPRGAVENELGRLAKEFGELEFIIRTVQEVATGTVGPIRVRTIASSDFMVFLAQHSGEAAMLAWMLERLITGYKAILDIRKLHGELATKMGKDTIPEVQKYAEESMVKTIKGIVDETVKKHSKADTGRKNELKVALTKVLNMLADRIDRGFNIEIRIEPLSLDDGGGDGLAKKNQKESEATKEHQRTIESASKVLEFTHRDGPPILHLEDKSSSKDGGNP